LEFAQLFPVIQLFLVFFILQEFVLTTGNCHVQTHPSDLSPLETKNETIIILVTIISCQYYNDIL
jgi:hypothetical protein